MAKILNLKARMAKRGEKESTTKEFEREMTTIIWGTEAEVETKKRILLSIYAYAYEFENDSIVEDSVYDKLSMQITKECYTGNKVMDEFFEERYDPFTSMWIRHHPELKGIKRLYDQYYKL